MSHSHNFLWTDIAGLHLTPEDKEILTHPYISGVILFSKNYESVSQLQSLTQSIKAISPELIITVDQEGGRVQRFREGFTQLPSMGYWGEQFQADAEKAAVAFSHTLRDMVHELKNVGIYSSLVPVLDIDYQRNAVIGHRSFGSNAHNVKQLSAFMIEQLHALKMPVTGKHFPGHGWVCADSHLELPIDERTWQVIEAHDLQPFSQLSARLDAVMLAHIVYEQLDPLPVCMSRFWVQDILRQQLRFDGLVMSDDLSMHALKEMGSYADRASRVLEAGCDILLVCNARAGVVDILDNVRLGKNPEFHRRLSHYSRFL